VVNGGHRSGRAAWTTLRGRGSSIRQSQGPRPLWLRGLVLSNSVILAGRRVSSGLVRRVALRWSPGTPQAAGSAGLGWAGLGDYPANSWSLR